LLATYVKLYLMSRNLIQWVLDRVTSASTGGPDHGDHADEAETLHPNRPSDLTIDEEGWLTGTDVERIPTERTQALVHNVPLGVVWHWTATCGVGRRLALRIAKLPKAGERAASWGTLIPAKGPMVQSASMLRGTWHAGAVSARAFTKVLNDEGSGTRPAGYAHETTLLRGWSMAPHTMAERRTKEVSANSLLHGVEIENLGELRSVNGKWRPWPFKADTRPLPTGELVESAKGRHYHAYTEHQEAQAERLVRAMATTYGLRPQDFRYYHMDIDPGRKTDPGPVWDDIVTGLLKRVF
jgi:hypothetical protein